MSQLVCVGQIINVHGIKGAIKIKSYLTNPMDIDSFGPVTDKQEKQLFHLKAHSQKQGIVLASVKGVNDRTTAEALKGMYLYVNRAQLPESKSDEYYYCDLVGLTVMRGDKVFGTVESVENFGAGDIVNIKLTNGKVYPFDFSDATFPVVSIAEKKMEICLPAGMEEVIHED